jgi:4-amino-4-deoxy-L-arabinose transferase-like glycosyltransferase
MTAGEARMSARRVVLIIILVTAAARIVIAAVNGLGIDEAYSVGNARILSLAYVDHPPLHMWIVWLAAWVAGSEAALVVRLPFITLFAGSTWLMYRLGRVLHGEQAGLWAAVWLNVVPVFSLVHAGGVLPDGPLIFFLLATANVLAGIFFGRSPRPTVAWLGAGTLAGLALLSKYNAIFLCLGTFAFLLTVPRHRHWLATPGPWLALLAALIVSSPAIVWNLQHGMAGFAFQGGRVAAGANGGNALGQIGGQALYLSPWLFVPFAIALVRSLIRGPEDEKDWFLAMLAVGPIAVFTLIAIWSPGLPHWPMPGWLFALALPPLTTRPPFLRGFAIASGAILGVVALGFRGARIRPRPCAVDASALADVRPDSGAGRLEGAAGGSRRTRTARTGHVRGGTALARGRQGKLRARARGARVLPLCRAASFPLPRRPPRREWERCGPRVARLGKRRLAAAAGGKLRQRGAARSGRDYPPRRTGSYP